MCNLYNLTRPQSEIGKVSGVKHDDTSNLPSLPGILPNTTAPVIRMREGHERDAAACTAAQGCLVAHAGDRPAAVELRHPDRRGGGPAALMAGADEDA
jgi:hypothetical protein